MTRYDPTGWIKDLQKQRDKLEKELEKVEEYNKKNNPEYADTLCILYAKVESLQKELKLETERLESVETLYSKLMKRATAAEKEVESLKAQSVKHSVASYVQHIIDQETLMSSPEPDSGLKREQEKNARLIKGLYYIKGYAHGKDYRTVSDLVDAILERNK
jgi:chromosome segregation ATPase